MTEFKRERRYVVVKISDLNATELTLEEIKAFNLVCDKVSITRVRKFKKPLQCVVVESDWPEYEPTWAAIEKRMAAISVNHHESEKVVEDIRRATECHNCLGKGYTEHYHDAGDHFGAGTSPFSGWERGPCKACNSTGKV